MNGSKQYQYHQNAQQAAAAASPVCRYYRSLNLIDKALPLNVASPPELRQRRHFKFNGMNFETSPLALTSHMPQQHNDDGDDDDDADDDNADNDDDDVRDDDDRSIPPYTQSAGHAATYKTSSKPSLLTPADAYEMEKMLQRSASYKTMQQQQRQHQQHQHQQDSLAHSYLAGGEDSYSMITQNPRVQQVLAKYSWKEEQRRQAKDEEDVDDNNDDDIDDDDHNRGNNLLKRSNSCCDMLSNEYNNNNNNNRQREQQQQHHYHRMQDYFGGGEETFQEEEAEQPKKRLISHRMRRKQGTCSYRNRTVGGTSVDGGVAVLRKMDSSSKMDYITLMGFLLGYLASNLLYFLCWYFSWLNRQVMKMRQHFLGQTNLSEFFDFEDTTRYSIKRKLIFAPIIVIFSILYCVVNVLHLLIKVVRSDVPRTVVDLVQRTARSYHC